MNCRYLASETSPVDQANLNVLRGAMKVLDDPKDKSKHVIEIDYKFSVSPYVAFRPEVSNINLGKATSIALLKRLQTNGLAQDFHAKMMEGMNAGHSMFLTPQKRAELEGLPVYFCSLNYVQKNSTLTKKIRPTSNFSAPHSSGSFNLLVVNGPNILNSSKRVLIKFYNYGHAITCDISTAYRSI